MHLFLKIKTFSLYVQFVKWQFLYSITFFKCSIPHHFIFILAPTHVHLSVGIIYCPSMSILHSSHFSLFPFLLLFTLTFDTYHLTLPPYTTHTHFIFIYFILFTHSVTLIYYYFNLTPTSPFSFPSYPHIISSFTLSLIPIVFSYHIPGPLIPFTTLFIHLLFRIFSILQ